MLLLRTGCWVQVGGGGAGEKGEGMEMDKLAATESSRDVEHRTGSTVGDTAPTARGALSDTVTTARVTGGGGSLSYRNI